jgi:hypothetical protein
MAVTGVPFDQLPEAVQAVADGSVQGKMVAVVGGSAG